MADACVTMTVSRVDGAEFSDDEWEALRAKLGEVDLGVDELGAPFEPLVGHRDDVFGPPTPFRVLLRRYWGEELDCVVFDGESFELARFDLMMIHGEEHDVPDLSRDIGDHDRKFTELMSRDLARARRTAEVFARTIGPTYRCEAASEFW